MELRLKAVRREAPSPTAASQRTRRPVVRAPGDVYKRGQKAWINGVAIRIVRQVLRNKPAYRVRLHNDPKDQGQEPDNVPTRRLILYHHHQAQKGWVVDGCFISDNADIRVDMFGKKQKPRRRSPVKSHHKIMP